MSQFGKPADHPKQDQEAGLSAIRIPGPKSRRITQYDAGIAFSICEEVAQGRTLDKICGDGSGFPSRMTFWRWAVNNPEVARAYHTARELSAHAMEEEALGLAREIKDSPGSGAKVRAYDVAMGQLRWSASRRNPRVYSERAAIQITVPIQINTPMDLGQGADGGAELPGVYTLTGQVELPQEPEYIAGGAGNDPRAEEGDEPLFVKKERGERGPAAKVKPGPQMGSRRPDRGPQQVKAAMKAVREARNVEVSQETDISTQASPPTGDGPQ